MASGDAVNQMPRYLLAGTPVGEKKPRVKVLPDETNVSPSVMLLLLLSVSDAVPAAEALSKSKNTGKIRVTRYDKSLVILVASTSDGCLLLQLKKIRGTNTDIYDHVGARL
jgi:hypothetical protein